MKYFVTVEGREFEIVIDGGQVRVGDQAWEAHLTAIPGTPLRHLLIGDRSFTLPVHRLGPGTWHMAFQGEAWEAEVVDARTRHIRSLTGHGGRRAGDLALRAPMPGLVVKVEVEAGATIREGQGLVVLEAMKMQNELRATAARVVKAVKVQAGQPVEKGQVLVEFEDAG